MKNKKLIGAIVAVIVVVLSFWGGMAYGKKNMAPKNSGGQNRMGQFGANGMGNRVGGMRGAGGFNSGEIISKDDKSITIKLTDGGSKIILLGGSTKVSKTVDGSASDLVIGKQVTVTGVSNSDGSVTAQSVQLRTNAVNPIGTTQTKTVSQ